jgi:NADH dehydrogenase (ubiquinone) flavoprotein 2
VIQINDDFYEDLTPETTIKILDALARGETPKPGPQSSRKTSENAQGMTTWVSLSCYGLVAQSAGTGC